MSRSDKTRAGATAACILTILIAGCQGGDSTAVDGPGRRGGAADRVGAGSAEGLDFGEDWDAAAARRGPRLPAAAAADDLPHWAIVLGTYTGPDHRRAAETMAQGCATIDPRLALATVRTSEKGSMVLYGRYDGSSDPAARRDLDWIKGLEIGSRPVFPRALLSPISTGPSPDAFRPYSLLGVRRLYPNVNPLYTLQIAVWSDFGSNRMTLEEVRARAEEYVRTLRSQNVEAYFHHEAEKRISTVTVGLFDHTAFDPQSGLRAPEVDALLHAFPAHLVNDEPLREPIDPRRPDRGTRIQRPRLVLVP